MSDAAARPDTIVCNDIVIERVGVSGTIRAIDGVSFTLTRGETLGIVGSAGSGKSSLAASLAGRKDATVRVVGGDAHVHGISVRHPGLRRRELGALTGYLRQGAGAKLEAGLTVHDIVAGPIVQRDRRVNTRALQLRVATLLDELRLTLGAATKYPYELSAGMRQRVAIARALILDPHLLIADGLLDNLDIDVQPVVIEAVRRRQRQYDMAALIISNDPAEMRAVGADTLVLRDGHTVARGPADDLRWTPGTDTTRAGT